MAEAAKRWMQAGLAPQKNKWLKAFWCGLGVVMFPCKIPSGLCMRTPKRQVKVGMDEIQKLIIQFHNNVRAEIRLFGEFKFIGNVDESPLSFSGGPPGKGLQGKPPHPSFAAPRRWSASCFTSLRPLDEFVNQF